MNRYTAVERMVREPHVTTTSNGIKRAFFTIAVDRRTADNQTDYVPCVAWRTNAEFVEKYLGKGSLVAIDGRFTSSDFKQADGSIETRYEITIEGIKGLESKATVEARKKESNATEVKVVDNSKSKEIKFTEESKSDSKSDDKDFSWDFES